MINNIPGIAEAVLAVLAGIVGVFSLGWGIFNKFKSTALSLIVQHQEQDVDISHPTITKHYITREELAERLCSIENALYRIENREHTDIIRFDK